MKLLNFSLILLSLNLISCSKNENHENEEHDPVEKVHLDFASGFDIKDYGDYKTVTVNTPFPGAGDAITWYLLPRGSELKGKFKDKRVIEIPIETIVCTSTTHVPLLEYLGVDNALIGFPETDYISSPTVRKRINEGEVVDLGSQMNLNLEMLISLQPDLVMDYIMSGDISRLEKIEQSGIPVILNSEYLESHPLGRAEWIKFMAVFFDKSAVADSVFDRIQREYLNTSSLIQEVNTRPTVLSGVVYGDSWFLPGGNNYAAKILKDAGGKYLWEDNPSSGFLELSFESVYNKAYNADFWIGVASYTSFNQLIEGDSRYAQFKPFKERNIYSYNKRIGEMGGNEYLELGYLRPDIILKDLVSIIHPEHMDQDYDLFFYEKLK